MRATIAQPRFCRPFPTSVFRRFCENPYHGHAVLAHHGTTFQDTTLTTCLRYFCCVCLPFVPHPSIPSRVSLGFARFTAYQVLIGVHQGKRRRSNMVRPPPPIPALPSGCRLRCMPVFPILCSCCVLSLFRFCFLRFPFSLFRVPCVALSFAGPPWWWCNPARAARAAGAHGGRKCSCASTTV